MSDRLRGPHDLDPAYQADDILHLILMPTEQCNFRCHYCYETFDHDRMDRSVVRGIKNLLSRRAERLHHLFIAWFGGEPLLAPDIVEEIQSHVQLLSRENPWLQCWSSMTTNGYGLRPERFARLLRLGVREYQISFDGPREVHDTKRVRGGGQGTFDRIWENLVAAARTNEDFEILLRVHIDRDNRAAIPRFIEECRATFGGDERFRLLPAPLVRMGGPNDRDLNVFEGTAREQVVEEAKRHARAQGVAVYPEARHTSACYASWANSFVVRSDGRLGKCTVALSHAANTVGKLGEDGRLELDEPRMAPWLRGLSSGDPHELSCPKRGLADGTASATPKLLQIQPLAAATGGG